MRILLIFEKQNSAISCENLAENFLGTSSKIGVQANNEGIQTSEWLVLEI